MVAKDYLYISRDGEDLKGPWSWLDIVNPGDYASMKELCFAIQEAGESVLLKNMPPTDGIVKCSICGMYFLPDHICPQTEAINDV